MAQAVELLFHRPILDENHDLQQVRRMAAGDEDALREIYAVYGQRLYAYALRLTSDPYLAEDVVQDSLVAAWQGAPRFRGDSKVTTWLLGIVHHKALNAIRARCPSPLDEIQESAAAPGLLPDEQAAVSEQRRLIRAGLDELSLEHRLTLELVFYQGLSLAEAAEVCGCPVGTVKSRLSYAKASLRRVLSRNGIVAEAVDE